MLVYKVVWSLKILKAVPNNFVRYHTDYFLCFVFFPVSQLSWRHTSFCRRIEKKTFLVLPIVFNHSIPLTTLKFQKFFKRSDFIFCVSSPRNIFYFFLNIHYSFVHLIRFLFIALVKVLKYFSSKYFSVTKFTVLLVFKEPLTLYIINPPQGNLFLSLPLPTLLNYTSLFLPNHSLFILFLLSQSYTLTLLHFQAFLQLF